MSSITILAAPKRRKLAIKFKLGEPLPVTRPQLLTRRREGVRVFVRGADGVKEDRGVQMVEAAVIADPYRGLQVGQVVDRPRRGGAFTRAVTAAFAKHDAEGMRKRSTARREARAARDAEARTNVEAFAYLEALADLDDGRDEDVVQA